MSRLVPINERQRRPPVEMQKLTGLYEYYVYRHIRLDINQPFYVGIGTMQNKSRNPYLRARMFTIRGKEWKEIATRSGYKIDIIYESNDYEEIIAKEIEFIALYGRMNTSSTGILINLTDGGPGQINAKRSAEFCKAVGERGRNSRHTEEAKRKISESALRRGYRSAKHVSSVPICQYSFEGLFIKKWDCIKDVNRSLGITTQAICNAAGEAKQKHHYASGYYWYYSYQGKNVPTFKVALFRPIIQTDKDGIEIAKFINSSDASIKLFGTKNLRSGINKVIRGETKKYKGLYFKYDNDSLTYGGKKKIIINKFGVDMTLALGGSGNAK